MVLKRERGCRQILKQIRNVFNVFMREQGWVEKAYFTFETAISAAVFCCQFICCHQVHPAYASSLDAVAFICSEVVGEESKKKFVVLRW